MFPIKNKDTENFHFTTSFLLNIEIFRRRSRNPHIVILTLCILLTRRIAYFRPKGGVAEKNAAISAIFQIIFLNANRMHRKLTFQKRPKNAGKRLFPAQRRLLHTFRRPMTRCPLAADRSAAGCGRTDTKLALGGQPTGKRSDGRKNSYKRTKIARKPFIFV